MAAEKTTIFSPQLAARFDRLVTLYPVKRSALVPMLLYAQDEIGYISDAVVAEVAQRIGITELDVRNVVSYYSLMRTKPVGKYHVQVCTNISCMLRGGNELLHHCSQRLGIGQGWCQRFFNKCINVLTQQRLSQGAMVNGGRGNAGGIEFWKGLQQCFHRGEGLAVVWLCQRLGAR